MSKLKTDKSSPLHGMLYMALAASLFPVKDSLLKAQDPAVPALLAISVYFLTQLLIGHIGLFATRDPARSNPFAAITRLNVVRSVTLTISLSLFFVSLRYVPISVAVTLFTVQSLFCLVFGKILLNEGFRLFHIAMIGVASIGVGLIIRPDMEGTFDPHNLLPVISAGFFGLYIILTRKLTAPQSTPQSTFQLLCHDGAMASVSTAAIFGVMLASDVSSWPTSPPPVAVFVIPPVLAACVGTVSSLAMIKAARLAPATKLAAPSYLEIVSAALIGYFIFSETLDRITLIGIALIVCACLTTAIAADKLAANKKPPVDDQGF